MAIISIYAGVNIETEGAGSLILVMIMALVTLATRWDDMYVMSFSDTPSCRSEDLQ